MFPAGDGRVHSTEVVDTKVTGSGTPSTKHPSPHVSFLKCSPCTRMRFESPSMGELAGFSRLMIGRGTTRTSATPGARYPLTIKPTEESPEHGCLLQDRGLSQSAVVVEMYVPVVRAPSVELEFFAVGSGKGVLNWHSIALFMEIPTP